MPPTGFSDCMAQVSLLGNSPKQANAFDHRLFILFSLIVIDLAQKNFTGIFYKNLIIT